MQMRFVIRLSLNFFKLAHHHDCLFFCFFGLYCV